VKSSFKNLLYALILPAIGIPLINGFATGTSTGETLIKSVGPIVLWVLPIFAVIGVLRDMGGAD
jgi:hypothetical protein